MTVDSVCGNATHCLHQALASLLERMGFAAVSLAAVVALNALLNRKSEVEACHGS